MSGLEQANVHLVDSLEEVENMLAWLGERREFLAFDIETTGLNLSRDRIRLVQFGDPRHGWAIPYADWKGAVREVVKRYDRKMVAHNLPFDDGFLARDGIDIPQLLAHDTMTMCHLLDSRGGIGLKPASARYVDKRAWMGKNMLSEAFQKGGWSWATIPEDHPSYWLYSALDTVLTSMLAETLWPKVQPYRYIYEVELACQRVLRQARLNGMLIDLDYSRAQYNQLGVDIEGLSQQIPFTPSKDKQLIEYLRREGAHLWRRTAKGNISVDDEVLAELEPRFPVAGTVRQWRQKERLRSAYFANFLGMNVDGVLRCNIKPLGARTGRMSITEPALQTIPRGPYVRDAFIARDGQQLIAADFNGAEMRVMAHYAQERTMIDAYKNGEDIHMWTAREVYGRDVDKKSEERQLAKNVGFANIYGAGDAKIAWMTGQSLYEVEQFKAKYNQLFPRIAECMSNIIAQARGRLEHEGEAYVITRLGRKLLVDSKKLYAAINYLIQSTATADVTKLKLVQLDAAGLGAFIRLPVHDEIIFEAPDDCVPDVVRTIEEVMPERELFDCPLEIEHDTVRRWGDKYRD